MADDLRVLSPGTILLDYRIEAVLGSGTFGITYRARWEDRQRTVAIKEFFPREIAVRDGSKSVRPTGSAEERETFEWGLASFLKEAQTLAKLDHPNIVEVLRFFRLNGTAYLVMDYCEGQPLNKVVSKDTPLSPEQFEPIFLALLDGLEHVHGAGIMHRDIKPGNIYLRADGSPVLLDFGAARVALADHSRSVTSLLTVGYGAFEQYSTRSSQQGPWTDIYGLAATMYNAATGQTPIDSAERILNDTLRPLTQVAAARYPGQGRLLAMIDAGLAVRPEARPRTVGDWRKMLVDDGRKRDGGDGNGGATQGGGANPPPLNPTVKALILVIGGVLAITVILGILVGIGKHDTPIDAPSIAATDGMTSDTGVPFVVQSPTGTPSFSPNDLASQLAQTAAGKAREAAAAARDAAQTAENSSDCPADDNAYWSNCYAHSVFANNTKSYSGHWLNNNIDGYGIYKYANGDVYAGHFAEGGRDGYGIYTYKDGSRYEGEWTKEKYDGYGVLFNTAGQIEYAGAYKDDKQAPAEVPKM